MLESYRTRLTNKYTTVLSKLLSKGHILFNGRTNREASEDVTVGDVTVPKGMRVDIAIDAVHYDPEIYPDPEKFIPER